MKALTLQHGKLSLDNDVLSPKAGHGEVLLKIRLAGICGTDLALLTGYAGFSGIPGHEFAAEVVEVGDTVSADWLGKRVVAEINQWCGECEQCARHHVGHCLNRKVIGIRDHQGAFAEQLVVKVNTLHTIPDNVSDQQSVFIEPLAAAFRIVEQLQFHPFQNLLLVGAGRLGQLIARVMVLQGKQVSVVTRHVQQRELLRGLPLVCIDEPALKARSFDVTIDATGHASGLALALKATRPSGICVMKSSYPGPLSLDLTQLVVDEVTLLGSRCGPFAMAIDALAKGEIETASLIDGCYPLDQYRAAFSKVTQKASMKVLLKM